MYLAYIDDSGNVGDHRKGGSMSFTLGCILVSAPEWPSVFDQVIAFRRFLRDAYGVPVRAEIKANYLIRNSGPFAAHPLSEIKRYKIYRGLLRLQQKLELDAFAVVIKKTHMPIGTDPRAKAWEFMLQRLERFTTKAGEQILLVHDEGEHLLIRGWARKARRAGGAGSAFGTGMIRLPFGLLLDDPVPRNSAHSYFISARRSKCIRGFSTTLSTTTKKCPNRS